MLPDIRLDPLLPAPPTAPLWLPTDLSGILRHQLAAPLGPDLALAGQYPAALVGSLCAEASPAIVTFGDLIHHPAPPVELLRAVKGFAKSRRNHPEAPLPVEIADLLYVLTIVLAQRMGEPISRLTPEALRGAVAWALGQHWLDAEIRAILEAAR
jgi:hypothetical protein